MVELWAEIPAAAPGKPGAAEALGSLISRTSVRRPPPPEESAMLVVDETALTYEKLRPLKPTVTASFPVYHDLTNTLVGAEANPDDTVAHVWPPLPATPTPTRPRSP